MFPSSFGLQFGIIFLRMKIRDLGVLILLTGALCVVIVGRLWITYCFILRRLIGCGVLFLNLFGFRGSYQEQFLICILVGGIGWGNTRLTCGIQFCCAYCSVYGGSVIDGYLRTWIAPKTNCLLLLVDLDWSQSWGLTSSDSLPSFLCSLLVCN